MDSAVLEELLAKYQELRATEGRSAKLDARIEALDRERERYRIHGFGVDCRSCATGVLRFIGRRQEHSLEHQQMDAGPLVSRVLAVV